MGQALSVLFLVEWQVDGEPMLRVQSDNVQIHISSPKPMRGEVTFYPSRNEKV